MSFRTAFVMIFFACFVLVTSGCETPEDQNEGATDHASNLKRRIVFHDDGQCLDEAPLETPEQFIRDYIDRELSDVPITTFCILAASPDMTLYDSKVGEVINERFHFQKTHYKAIGVLRENGTDILKLVVEHLKPRGIEVMAAIRMSDTHHQELVLSNAGASRFAIEHPEYVIKQPDGRSNETALDYSYPEVRSHRMAILREIAENYDVDGLELNFIRWAKHFPLDQGREKAHILTSFMGEVHEMLKEAAEKRGRKHLTLGAMVPETIDACWKAGVDVETWVKNGWLDYVIAAPWNETDPMIPVDEFAEFTMGTNCQLLAQMGNLIGANSSPLPKIKGRGTGQVRDTYHGMLITVPEAKACAANYYDWGAEGISFWNVGCHMSPEGTRPTAYPRYWNQMYGWMKAVIDPHKVREGSRHYHYLTLFKNHYLEGAESRNRPWFVKGLSPLGSKKIEPLEFPASDIGTRKVFPFRMADGRNGSHDIPGTVRFWIYHVTPQDKITVDINGRKIDDAVITKYPAGEFRYGLPGVRYEIDLIQCLPFRGDNELGITLETKSKREHTPYMEELEVLVD